MIRLWRVPVTLPENQRPLPKHICHHQVPQHRESRDSEWVSHCPPIPAGQAQSPHSLEISSLRRPLASSASNLRQQMISIYFDPMEVPATAGLLKPAGRPTEKVRHTPAVDRVAAPVVLYRVDLALAEATLAGQIRQALTRLPQTPNQPLATTNRRS